MKSFDRTLMVGLTALALVAVFWFVVLAPKRNEASDLKDEVDRLEAAVADQQETIAFAEQARREFPGDYRRLVTLGKAVPEDADTSSFLAQLSGISRRAKVEFRALELVDEAVTGAAPAPVPPAEEGGSTEEQPATDEVPAEQTAPTPAPTATEAAAASLPIGATVGSAGLPVLPYKLEFQGGFFEIAGFMRGLDSLVGLKKQEVRSKGRLMTIDGFVLSRDLQKGFPSLLAAMAVTTYVTPADQGLTGGASPSEPASPPPDVLPASDAAGPEAASSEPTSTPATTEGGGP